MVLQPITIIIGLEIQRASLQLYYNVSNKFKRAFENECTRNSELRFLILSIWMVDPTARSMKFKINCIKIIRRKHLRRNVVEEFIIESRAGISVASFSWNLTLYIGKLLFGDQVPAVVARLANSLYDRCTANTLDLDTRFLLTVWILNFNSSNETRNNAGELSSLLNTGNFIFQIIRRVLFFEISEKGLRLGSLVTLQRPRGWNYRPSMGSFVVGQRVSEITFALSRFFDSKCFHRDESLKYFLPPATFPMTLDAPFVSVRTLCRFVSMYTRDVFRRAPGREQREFISADDRIAPGRKDPAKFDYTWVSSPPLFISRKRALCTRIHSKQT